MNFKQHLILFHSLYLKNFLPSFAEISYLPRLFPYHGIHFLISLNVCFPPITVKSAVHSQPLFPNFHPGTYFPVPYYWKLSKRPRDVHLISPVQFLSRALLSPIPLPLVHVHLNVYEMNMIKRKLLI